MAGLPRTPPGGCLGLSLLFLLMAPPPALLQPAPLVNIHVSGTSMGGRVLQSTPDTERRALLALAQSLIPKTRTTNETLPNWWATVAGWTPRLFPCNPKPWLFLKCLSMSVVALNISAETTRAVILEGEIPWGALVGLPNLDKVSITGQRVYGSLPSPDAPPLPLVYLDLNHNQLASISPSISLLTKLVYLDLNSSGVHGSLPSEISSLSSLSLLDLGQNNLGGTIPSSWSALTALKYLRLKNNTLQGTLPDGISSLTAMKYLILENTALSGFVPSSWSALKALEILDLANNTLQGSFPDAISSLTALVILDLSNNKFSGVIPPAVWASTYFVFLDGNYFTGSVPNNKSRFVMVYNNCLFYKSQRPQQECPAFKATVPKSPMNWGLIIGLSVGGVILINEDEDNDENGGRGDDTVGHNDGDEGEDGEELSQ